MYVCTWQCFQWPFSANCNDKKETYTKDKAAYYHIMTYNNIDKQKEIVFCTCQGVANTTIYCETNLCKMYSITCHIFLRKSYLLVLRFFVLFFIFILGLFLDSLGFFLFGLFWGNSGLWQKIGRAGKFRVGWWISVIAVPMKEDWWIACSFRPGLNLSARMCVVFMNVVHTKAQI